MKTIILFLALSASSALAQAEAAQSPEERFNALHEQLYGFRMPNTASEIVNLRAVGTGDRPEPELPEQVLLSDDAAALRAIFSANAMRARSAGSSGDPAASVAIPATVGASNTFSASTLPWARAQ